MFVTPPRPIVHIVDDHASFRSSLGRLLQAAGFDARLFASGDEFLAQYDGGAGCVVIDVHMPGMSGLELEEVLAHRPDGPPVILVSGQMTFDLFDASQRLRVVACLAKPIEPTQLIETVTAALERDSAVRRLRAS